MEIQSYIDLQTYNDLKDLVGADFLAELIDTYCPETEDLVQKLRQALANGDASTFGRLAHSIKTSSASLGALGFSQQARELEMVGKSGDLAGAGPKVEQLAADLSQVRRCLMELKNEP